MNNMIEEKFPFLKLEVILKCMEADIFGITPRQFLKFN